GYAFPFEGPGFWGPISGVVAVDPAGERILGISFVRHQETPGLGGRISEGWFRDQFRGKPLEVRDGRVLEFVFRPPTGEREVEAITGATQTSTRLARFLNAFLARLPGRAVFRGGRG
ncbi:MAG: FMN-binding protein, partial [Candidatus Dadabacteria bacterium]